VEHPDADEVAAPETEVRPEDGIYLQFPGRERHQAFIRAPRVLMEVSEHTDTEGALDNLIIEGDNLDAMSALRAQYAEQVDVVIADPPYGGDRQAVRYRDDSTGWLTQMEPTFHLIHSLLAETGVMFVHIDDDQLFNLGVLLDDIFDERNRVGILVWKSATENRPPRLATEHEYILVYAKNIDRCPKPWRGPIEFARAMLLDAYAELRREVGSVRWCGGDGRAGSRVLQASKADRRRSDRTSRERPISSAIRTTTTGSGHPPAARTRTGVTGSDAKRRWVRRSYPDPGRSLRRWTRASAPRAVSALRTGVVKLLATRQSVSA